MAVIALVGWVLNSLLGLYMLKARRQRLALFHLAVMLTGLGLWVGFVAADVVALAWLAWAVLNVGNGLGDTLLTRGWRRRNPTAPGNAYWQAAKEATFTTKRPLPLAHGFLAGGTYFTALAAAVISS
ncbi:hypothetical protein PV646_23980 [Streptomyces sp. ID05-26A]|nr:hypothetical protein [Streptomyces sp. ID05-26A]